MIEEPPPPATGPGPYRVCVVCLGNICRSPMAEVVLRAELDDAGLARSVVVDSAGTGGWHEGDPMDARARAALADRGYDGTRHRARKFDPAWFADRDLVLAMDDENLADLRELAPDAEAAARVRLFRAFDPSAGDDPTVPDPYYGGDDGFAYVLDMIESAAKALVTSLERG
ncbi:MAG TPA: low molecular weight protein-tyrosine-phosphatase [Streptosporangiaceae bacterium]|jgi:protein-tyrosine phosphatase